MNEANRFLFIYYACQYQGENIILSEMFVIVQGKVGPLMGQGFFWISGFILPFFVGHIGL